MYKIPVYFYNVGFGFLLYDQSEGVVEASPHPYLVCMSEILTGEFGSFVNRYVVSGITEDGSTSLLYVSEPFIAELDLFLNPNIDKLPLDFFRKAGLEHSIL